MTRLTICDYTARPGETCINGILTHDDDIIVAIAPVQMTRGRIVFVVVVIVTDREIFSTSINIAWIPIWVKILCEDGRR